MPLALALLLLFLASPASAETGRHDVAPERRERVTCSIAAALKFGVPTDVMLAIADVEGGRPGLRMQNRNGSFDIGSMQFNTRYLRDLERRYAITAADVAAAGCYPYELAAWRLRRHFEFDTGDAWTRAANYHSRSTVENRKYRAKLIAKAGAWARWLSERFGTREVGRAPLRPARRQRELQSPRQRSDFKHGAEDPELAALLDQLEDRKSVPQPGRNESQSSSETTPRLSLPTGVQLPQHRGYVLIDPSRSWGTSTTIHALTAAFDEIVAVEPTVPRVEVHDLSLQFGGRMRGHKSHQSGRDVDITYYRRDPKLHVGQRVLPTELDPIRQWRLLRWWLERDQAEFIFVDYALQGPLYAAAIADGSTDRQLGEWFQYPRGPEVRAGIIRHVPNHSNHMHVRFRCRCSDISRLGDSLIKPRLADEAEAELQELLAE